MEQLSRAFALKMYAIWRFQFLQAMNSRELLHGFTTCYCFPANPVVCGYSSAVIRAELSFFRKLSRKEKGSLPKRASSRDPLSERALKQLRFLLSHVLGMIASPASTGRLVLGNS